MSWRFPNEFFWPNFFYWATSYKMYLNCKNCKKNNWIFFYFGLKWNDFYCLKWSMRSIVTRHWSWTTWTTCCPRTVCWASDTRPQNSQTWRSLYWTSLIGRFPSRQLLSLCPTFWWCLWTTTTSLMVTQYYQSLL